MDGLTVRNLARVAPDGAGRAYYTAEVVNGDTVVAVSREAGSWLAVSARVGDEAPTPCLRDVRPLVAAALQREVGKIERAERRAQGVEEAA